MPDSQAKNPRPPAESEPAAEAPADGGPNGGGHAAESSRATGPERALALRIIAAGLGCWALALAGTLLIPSWHSGERHWWPYSCLTGLALGILGWIYTARGRGNAALID